MLMTADTVGGVWTFAIELCAALAKHNVEVTLFTMGRPPDDAQDAELQAQRNVRLVSTAYRLEWMQDCQGDVVDSGKALLQLAREVRPDVVHINGYYHAALPFDAPVLLTAHSCVASWWRACRRDALPIEWWRYLNWISDGVRAADMLTAPTHAFLKEFQALHGRARAGRAIWNGRDSAFFEAGPKKSIVLAAGRLWDEAKNIGLLCRIAKDLAAPVLVAGEEASPDGNSAALSGVEVLGRLNRTEMSARLCEAAVFASPARYEPFGLSVLEAALSGCALVLSDIPSFRELWEGAATFVQADEEDGWRDALNTLVEHPRLAAAKGAQARERAQRYSAKQMGDNYFRAYEAVQAAPALAPALVEAAA
jgi:glycosyltransferase involved in cell wall biosynthesis